LDATPPVGGLCGLGGSQQNGADVGSCCGECTLMQGLVEVRNLYGTGHGKGSTHKGPQPCHARLAVASAATFVEFIADTYRERQEKAAG